MSIKKIESTRNYYEMLKDLNLTDNTDDLNMKDNFNSYYSMYFNNHKESNFKYIANQKEFDGLVLSSLLNNKQFSICDYCFSIEPKNINMDSNGYHECNKCVDDKTKVA